MENCLLKNNGVSILFTPKSGWLKLLMFDEENQTLTVTMREKGVSYTYSKVPKVVWKALEGQIMEGESAGRMFNHLIKRNSKDYPLISRKVI